MTLSDQGAVYSGIVTANSFVKSGGTSSQYLMADDPKALVVAVVVFLQEQL